VELCEGEFGCPVHGHEEIELRLFSSDLGNVDVEIADGVLFERLFGRLVAFDFRQPAEVVALIAAMKRRAGEMRDGGLKRLEAIVERRQRVLAESHRNGLLLDRQDRRARVFRSHGCIVDEGPLPPLRNRLRIEKGKTAG
jgi:hypothetical protein